MFNRATEPANISFPWRERWSAQWIKDSRVVVKAIVIGFAAYINLIPNLAAARQMANRPRSPISGIYMIDRIQQGRPSGGTLPNDVEQWKTLVFDSPTRMSAVTADDSVLRYKTEYDKTKNVVTIFTGSNGKAKNTLTYSRVDANHLNLQGSIEGSAVTINMRRIDETKFLLPSRGFHWINETPLNR